jgi:hypothetical protein
MTEAQNNFLTSIYYLRLPFVFCADFRKSAKPFLSHLQAAAIAPLNDAAHRMRLKTREKLLK